jgi:hypothetical protein
MNGSQKAAWTVNQGGTMLAEVEVKELPTSVSGSPASVVVGQVHGQTNELCRLYFDGSTVYFVDRHGAQNGASERFLLHDSSGRTPKIAIGEKFDYSFHIDNAALTVDLLAGGTKYEAYDPISPDWRGDHLYFKAGVYNTVAPTASGATHVGSGEAVAEFFKVGMSHP